MKIKEDQIVTVWELDEREDADVIRAKVSSYEGKTKDDEAKYSSWFANFVGKAFKPARKLNKGDRIMLTNAKIENFYNSKTEKGYTNITIFEFDDAPEIEMKSKKK